MHINVWMDASSETKSPHVSAVLFTAIEKIDASKYARLCVGLALV